ncbi:MAG TPA: 6-bladed beta-propeller [Anaerolineae bacterium]|nr:6-bladed beta-propeller [Anaerolineae bacterium]
MIKNYIVLTLSIIFLVSCGGSEALAPTSTVEPTLVESTLSPTPEVTMTPETFDFPEITFDGMKDPYGIAINSLGNLYVTDAGKGRVLVFDAQGNLLSTWDKQGSGDGEFKSMGFGGLAIDSNDNVFVVDNGNFRIQKFDRDGNYITQWGSEGTGDSQFVRVIGIATDTDGNVYVTDDGNPFVQKFDNDGNFIIKFGAQGNGDGQFSHATGIAVDLQGNIFVADYELKRVQKFDSAGNFITAWKMGDDIGVSGIPEAIAIDSQGNVYVSDYLLGRIQIFDNDGNFISAIGGKSISSNPFKRPTGIIFDGNGKMFVVNQSGNNISIVDLP